RNRRQSKALSGFRQSHCSHARRAAIANSPLAPLGYAAMPARSLLFWVLMAAAGCNGASNGAAPADAAVIPPLTPGGMDTALAQIQAQIDGAKIDNKIDKTRADWRTSLPLPTQVAFAAGRTYLWTLVTSKGELRLKLLPEAAPMHVTSTIYLTLLG